MLRLVFSFESRCPSQSTFFVLLGLLSVCADVFSDDVVVVFIELLFGLSALGFESLFFLALVVVSFTLLQEFLLDFFIFCDETRHL